VHTAPGHGAEDFDVVKRHAESRLPVLCPVDDAGRFTAEAGGSLEGLEVLGAGNAAMLKVSPVCVCVCVTPTSMVLSCRPVVVPSLAVSCRTLRCTWSTLLGIVPAKPCHVVSCHVMSCHVMYLAMSSHVVLCVAVARCVWPAATH
jgi:hypothetical protein